MYIKLFIYKSGAYCLKGFIYKSVIYICVCVKKSLMFLYTNVVYIEKMFFIFLM